MKLKHLLFIATTLVCMFFASRSVAQNKVLDSLTNELEKYESRKREMGPGASKMIDTAKIRILSLLIPEIYYNEPEKAMKLSRLQLELSQKLNYKWGISNALNSMGSIYDQLGNYTLALDCFKKSLKIKHQEKDVEHICDSYANIGIVYTRTANYPEALDNFIKGLEYAKKNNDQFGIAGTYNNIAMVYMAQENFAETLKYLFKSVEIFNKMNDIQFTSVIYHNIGCTYIKLGKHDEAMLYLKKGLQDAIAVNDKITVANSYDAIGQVYQNRKNYPKALENYRISWEINQEINNSIGLGINYISIGYTYYKLGKITEAIQYIQKGLEMTKSKGESDSVKQAYMHLAEIYESIGNFKLAYQNHILYKQTADSIFTTEKDRRLSQLQLKYNYKSMQDSIQSVQEKKDLIAREQHQRESITRNFIYLSLGLAVIFLIILIFQRNKIAKIRRQKALVEERNRISRDLHDNLGAQLSTARMFVSSLKNNGNPSEMVDTTIDLLDDSIHELRKIMNNTNSSTLIEKGYLAATEELVNKINQLHVLNFTLSHHNMENRPNQHTEHELFRITQEIVNNTLKYAEAENVSLDIVRRDGQIILMYEDDGKGYDIHKVTKGNGLDNIETRVKSINGTVEFDSAPGCGARTIIEIPE